MAACLYANSKEILEFGAPLEDGPKSSETCEAARDNNGGPSGLHDAPAALLETPGGTALRVLQQGGTLKDAIAILDKAIAQGETTQLWNDWASIQYAAGNATEAERGYKQALKLSGRDRTASVNLSCLLLRQGRMKEAAMVLAPSSTMLTEYERTALAPLLDIVNQERKIERLEAAVEYLLIAALNADASRETGQASNEKLTAFFLDLALSLKPKVFFNIGAKDGSVACRCKKMIQDCEVWAFEANPQIYERFLATVSASGVRYTNLAIAGTTGPITIYVPPMLSPAVVDRNAVSVEPTTTGRSSLLKRNEDAPCIELTVNSARLDDVMSIRKMEGEGRDVALWIDVGGAADEVLSGAASVLGRTSILFVESENREFRNGQKKCADIATLLIAAGFVPFDRDREYGDLRFNTVFIHISCLHHLYPITYQLDRLPSKSHQISASPLTIGNRRPQNGRYATFAAHSMADTPIFVPVFNNPSYARSMLSQLSRLGLHNIYMIDNGSTSEEMHALLDEAEEVASVVRTGENNGPRDIVLRSANYECLPDVFCVTDPDLEFNPILPNDFLAHLLRLTRKHRVGKAGMALRIDDAGLMHDKKFHADGREYHATEWELQFWREHIDNLEDGSPVFRSPIDTTFALYNKNFFSPDNFLQAVRVAGRYTCRHLPWYRDSGLSAAEETLYRATQKFSFHLA